MTLNKKRILVTGGAAGLGAEIVKELIFQGHEVIAYDIKDGNDVTEPSYWLAATAFDGIINCAGVNAQEWFEDVTRESFDRVMGINAYGIVAMTQAILPALKESFDPFVINIVSNGAEKPMTASLAYNASKGAALMVTRQMARELTPKYGITVFSISPNKLAGTEMSAQIEAGVVRTRGWTPEYAAEYQAAALMHGLETPPQSVAGFIAYLIDSGAFKYLSGCDLKFGL